jgi:hypothetical protein
MQNKRFTKASELGQWEYCPRQWYLSKTRGVRINSDACRKGVAFHYAKSKGVKSVQQNQTMFITALVIGGIICLFFLLQ